MHIISGRLKGRKLKAPKGIRPTQQKVRKALFDILGDIHGAAFLELFAGSGAIGIEALSLGAKQAVFVENNINSLKILRGNLSCLLPAGCYLLFSTDILQAIKKMAGRNKKFDVIFLDPPYYDASERGCGDSLSKKTLKSINDYDILAGDGFLVCQHFKKDALPQVIGNLSLLRRSVYGDTCLSFYKKIESEATQR